MTAREIKPGTKVWAKTLSGEPILCTVIRREPDGQYLLHSPAHGYAICRWRREFEIEEAADGLSC